MLKVAQLIKFISDMNPQNTPARLAFFNFLKGFAQPDDELTPQLLNTFFVYCMDYPHWASNKSQLGHEVHFLLEHFNSFYQQKFDTSPARFPQNMQLIEIESITDLQAVLTTYLKRLYSEDDKIRLVSDQNKRIIALILKQDKSLDVRTFDRKCTLRDGHIEPLRTDLTLHYTPELELASEVLHKIEVAPYITAQFTINAGKVSGQLIRGYVFQKLLELKNDRLTEQTRLLFPIKRLEQFFVDRKTDPYYQELVSQLERTTNLIQQGDHDALKWSSIALTQAETALDNVFVGDKLLTLLIKDLKHATLAISNGASPAKASDDLVRLAKRTNEGSEECLKIIPLQKFDLIN